MAVLPINTNALSWGSLMARGNREPIDDSTLNFSYAHLLWELNQQNTYLPSTVTDNKGGSGNFYVGLITSVPYAAGNKGQFASFTENKLSMRGPWYVSYCDTDEPQGTGKFVFGGHGSTGNPNTYYADRIVLKREMDYALQQGTVSPLQLGTYYTGVGMWYDSYAASCQYTDGNQELPDGTYFPTSSYAEIFNDYKHNIAYGAYSHVEGGANYSDINAAYSHVEGHWNAAYNETSHAEGYQTKAFGKASHAEGQNTTAYGHASHAEGQNTTAFGTASHAEGGSAKAYGWLSHAEGYYTLAYKNKSHAEGEQTITYGEISHAEGARTITYGQASHAEGDGTIAKGDYSHAEGCKTIAREYYSHAEGLYTAAYGNASHAEGMFTTAYEYASHAEGRNTRAFWDASHAEGSSTTAYGGHAEGFRTIACKYYSHAEGQYTGAYGEVAHAEGNYTLAYGNNSHIEGNNAVAYGRVSHGEGNWTVAYGDNSHAEGAYSYAYGYASSAHNKSAAYGDFSTSFNIGVAYGAYSSAFGKQTTASGEDSHAEGDSTTANGEASHAEGYFTTASGKYSHAEGESTTASGDRSHAEGYYATASGDRSHAEGDSTRASGWYSHAEGFETTASGDSSHAEGDSTIASGDQSHAEGESTTASGNYSHAEGYYSYTIGKTSHVEGINSYSYGLCSHAEGGSVIAFGSYTHAEGAYTIAYGEASHTSGFYTQTSNKGEFATGNYNRSYTSGNDPLKSGGTLFTIGDGNGTEPQTETSTTYRHNVLEIHNNGAMVKNGPSYFNNDIYGPISFTYVEELGPLAKTGIVLRALLELPDYHKPTTTISVSGTTGNVEVGTSIVTKVWTNTPNNARATYKNSGSIDWAKTTNLLDDYSHVNISNAVTSYTFNQFNYNPGNGTTVSATYPATTTNNVSSFTSPAVVLGEPYKTYNLIGSVSGSFEYQHAALAYFPQLVDKGVYVTSTKGKTMDWFDDGTTQLNTVGARNAVGYYRIFAKCINNSDTVVNINTQLPSNRGTLTSGPQVNQLFTDNANCTINITGSINQTQLVWIAVPENDGQLAASPIWHFNKTGTTGALDDLTPRHTTTISDVDTANSQYKKNYTLYYWDFSIKGTSGPGGAAGDTVTFSITKKV